jgi:hypothetical protein
MEKRGEKSQQKKPSKKAQYERFQQTARDLGVDDEQSAQTFERAFEKIMPPRKKRP